MEYIVQDLCSFHQNWVSYGHKGGVYAETRTEDDATTLTLYLSFFFFISHGYIPIINSNLSPNLLLSYKNFKVCTIPAFNSQLVFVGLQYSYIIFHVPVFMLFDQESKGHSYQGELQQHQNKFPMSQCISLGTLDSFCNTNFWLLLNIHWPLEFR